MNKTLTDFIKVNAAQYPKVSKSRMYRFNHRINAELVKMGVEHNSTEFWMIKDRIAGRTIS
jgi:hypothetical protein